MTPGEFYKGFQEMCMLARFASLLDTEGMLGELASIEAIGPARYAAAHHRAEPNLVLIRELTVATQYLQDLDAKLREARTA